jgi:hypothetical protein
MTCERYWRDGILLVERGVGDPHRDGCADCTRAHASRRELVEALPLIGRSYTGDLRWQANVWRRIDGEAAREPWRWRWPLAGAVAVACVVALWIGRGGHRRVDEPPQFAIDRLDVAMRSSSGDADAHVDDRLRVTLGATTEVWIYRDGDFELRCHARQVSDGCAPSPDGKSLEVVLSTTGVYHALAIEAPAAPPGRRLDDDRAALTSAGAKPFEYSVTVR